MAQNVFFKKGLLANLPTSYSAGTFYVTTDERAMYLDIDDSTRIRLGDFIQVAAVENLPTEGASTSALYYCVKENILAKWNGSEWTQINKQPTADEMKVLLGLGTMAYKSEVAEGDLNSDLAAKINAASGAQHTHDNKSVLDGITAEKVAAWDASEQNAKDYADDLDEAMNARVEALEAIDHEHANKALLDTYTQTEADLADAVAKKHSHANADELAKIADGDKAKWDAVAADHLTSADKTTLENAIKEAKKAGTDANTALETYKVTNDARVLAVEEDVAEITDGTNGILAQAKAYSDGKLATARTEITAEIDADVKVVADDLAGYKTSNDAAVAAKVAKADYEADKATFATKTELGNVDAKFADYVTSASYTTDKAAIEKAIEDEGKARSEADAGFEARIADLEANFGDGEGTVEAQIAAAVAAEAEIARAAEKANADAIDALEGRMDTAEGKISALEGASATHATKSELEAVDAKFADYNTTEAQKAIDDAQDARIKAIEDDYLVEADIADFETKENVKKVADDLAAYVESNDAAVANRYTKEEADAKFALIADAYDDEEIRGLISDNADAIAAEKGRAEAAEENLQTQINTIMNNPDAEGAINSINEFTQYVKDHGTIADGFRADIDKNKEDIAANAKAIADQATSDAATYETKTDAAQKLTDAKAYTDAEVAKDRERLATLEAIDHDAYVDADATLKAELQAEIDADVKVVNDALEAYKTSNDAEVAKKANAADVYTKSETYTKTEVDAMLTWGEF